MDARAPVVGGGAAPEPTFPVEALAAYLDREGLGSGKLDVEPIGDGHSNLTFLLGRDEDRFVLRRPPHGPLAPSANDVVREAKLLGALQATNVRVPEVFAIHEDDDLIGAPFYVMSFIDGQVLLEQFPAGFGHDTPARISAELVDMLIELHSVDIGRTGLSAFGQPDGYLERQIRRFRGLLDRHATRPLPDLERVGDWLTDNRPESTEVCLVHGDYRIGNVLFSLHEPRLVAVLDWEMATIGDPLADLGYCTATWAEPGDTPNPVRDLSPITRQPGFPDREGLARDYARLTNRSLETLVWYEVLALWKAAIFLEGSYARFLAGASIDTYFAGLGEGVPLLARAALQRSKEA